MPAPDASTRTVEVSRFDPNGGPPGPVEIELDGPSDAPLSAERARALAGALLSSAVLMEAHSGP